MNSMYEKHSSRNIIAIDGPSGGGKSSISQGLAHRLGYSFLETGAMYRAATLHILRSKIDFSDLPHIMSAIDEMPLRVSLDPLVRSIFLGQEEVTQELRSDLVTQGVSAISALKPVRHAMVQMQRDLAIESAPTVVEGRDIGTVVFPQAGIKFYLTASAQARAQRRAAQLGIDDVTAIAEDLARRDQLDSSRVHSPLLQAEDAIVIDSSDLSQEETLQQMLSIVHSSLQQHNHR